MVSKLKSFRNNLRSFFSLFRRKPKDPKSIWKDSRYVIKHAFTASGIDYYCFDDLINKPYERALSAIDFYRELEMGVDVEYLKLHVKAIRECLTSKKVVDVYTIHKLNEQMAECIEFIRSPNLIYKVASVVYFDKNEDPTAYDAKYNDNKIRSWKRAFPDGSFFLLQPIKTLVPFIDESPLNLKNYDQTWEKIQALRLENLLSPLSDKDRQIAKSKTGELSPQ